MTNIVLALHYCHWIVSVQHLFRPSCNWPDNFTLKAMVKDPEWGGVVQELRAFTYWVIRGSHQLPISQWANHKIWYNLSRYLNNTLTGCLNLMLSQRLCSFETGPLVTLKGHWPRTSSYLSFIRLSQVCQGSRMLWAWKWLDFSYISKVIFDPFNSYLESIPMFQYAIIRG